MPLYATAMLEVIRFRNIRIGRKQAYLNKDYLPHIEKPTPKGNPPRKYNPVDMSEEDTQKWFLAEKMSDEYAEKHFNHSCDLILRDIKTKKIVWFAQNSGFDIIEVPNECPQCKEDGLIEVCGIQYAFGEVDRVGKNGVVACLDDNCCDVLPVFIWCSSCGKIFTDLSGMVGHAIHHMNKPKV